MLRRWLEFHRIQHLAGDIQDFDPGAINP